MLNYKTLLSAYLLKTRIVWIFSSLLFILNFGHGQCVDIEIVDLRGVLGYAQFDDLIVCGEADTLSFIVYSGEPDRILGFELEVNLPTGMHYVGWEFTQLA